MRKREFCELIKLKIWEILCHKEEELKLSLWSETQLRHKSNISRSYILRQFNARLNIFFEVYMNCYWVAFKEKYFYYDKFSSFFTDVRPLTKLSSAVVNFLPKNEKDSVVITRHIVRRHYQSLEGQLTWMETK